MKASAVALGLISALAGAQSREEGLVRSLKLLLQLTGARAAGLVFFPRRGAPISVLEGTRGAPALDRWLRDLLPLPPPRPGNPPVTAPPGWKGPGRSGLLHLPIGSGTRLAGRLLLLAPAGRRGPIRAALPPAFLREFGSSLEQVWRLHQRTLRLSVMNDITALLASTVPLEEIYQAFSAAVARLVEFDALAVTLIDRERRQFKAVDVTARSVPLPVSDMRLPLAETLVGWVAERRISRRVDDLTDPSVPSQSREILTARGYRSAVVVPLYCGEEVTGTLNLCHRRPLAFDDEDVEILLEVAILLAAAMENRRLLSETRSEEGRGG